MANATMENRVGNKNHLTSPASKKNCRSRPGDTPRKVRKAGYHASPLGEGGLDRYRTIEIDISKVGVLSNPIVDE